MRSLRRPVFVMLAMMFLGGCTKMIEIRVKPDLDESGKPVIDYDFHDTVFVKPGDRIVWACRECPPETEFTVTNLHFVADVDEIFEMLLPQAIEGPKKLEGRIQELESVQRRLSVPEQPAAEPSGEVSEEPDRVQDAVAAALKLLNELRSTLSPEKQRDLFKRDWEPPGNKFVAGTKRLRSERRVARGIGNGVWKFTWIVRRKGSVVEWDPHIIGHEGRTN